MAIHQAAIDRLNQGPSVEHPLTRGEIAQIKGDVTRLQNAVARLGG